MTSKIIDESEQQLKVIKELSTRKVSSLRLVMFFISLFMLVSTAILYSISMQYVAPNLIMKFFVPSIFIASLLYIFYFVKTLVIQPNVSDKTESIDNSDQCSKSEIEKSGTSTVFYISASACFVMLLYSLTLGYFYNTHEKNHFEKEYLKSLKSKEFALTEKLARDNKIDLRLSKSSETWALTRLDLVGGAGASMYVGNSYCTLNYANESLGDLKPKYVKYLSPGTLKKTDVDIAQLTIMIHEFGHCIDTTRDYATFNLHQINPSKPNDIIIGTAAIHPKYRDQIDRQKYYTYQFASQNSKRWKEVFADVYSVGYLYVNYPGLARNVSLAMQEFRTLNSAHDSHHNTACWLKLADQSIKPLSNSELLSWSDSIRNSRKCKW